MDTEHHDPVIPVGIKRVSRREIKLHVVTIVGLVTCFLSISIMMDGRRVARANSASTSQEERQSHLKRIRAEQDFFTNQVNLIRRAVAQIQSLNQELTRVSSLHQQILLTVDSALADRTDNLQKNGGTDSGWEEVQKQLKNPFDEFLIRFNTIHKATVEESNKKDLHLYEVENDFVNTNRYMESTLARLGRFVSECKSSTVEQRMISRCKQAIDVAKLMEIPDIATLFANISNLAEVLQQRVFQIQLALESKNREIQEVELERLKSIEMQFNQSTLNSSVLIYGMIAFCMALLLALCMPRFLKEESYPEWYKNESATNIFTIFVLSITILLLALSTKLSSEVLGTLIGGISGYVLGKHKPIERIRRDSNATQRS